MTLRSAGSSSLVAAGFRWDTADEVAGGGGRQNVQRGSGVTLHQVEKSAEIRQRGRNRIDELVLLSRVPGRHGTDLIAVEGRPANRRRAEAACTGTTGHSRVGKIGRLAGDVHDAGDGAGRGRSAIRCGSADFATARTPVPMVAPAKVNWLVFGFQVTMAWASCGRMPADFGLNDRAPRCQMEVAADVSMAVMPAQAAPTMMVRTPAEKPAKSAMVFGRLSPTTIGAMAMLTQRAKLILDGD